VREVALVSKREGFTSLLHHLAFGLRFLREFRERLAKFGLEVHPEKTGLTNSVDWRGPTGHSVKREAGNVHVSGVHPSLRDEHQRSLCSLVWRRTAAKRMRAKLESIKQELRRKMHEAVGVVGERLRRVVEGYYRCHAVPGNIATLSLFRDWLCRFWRTVLRPRS